MNEWFDHAPYYSLYIYHYIVRPHVRLIAAAMLAIMILAQINRISLRCEMPANSFLQDGSVSLNQSFFDAAPLISITGWARNETPIGIFCDKRWLKWRKGIRKSRKAGITVWPRRVNAVRLPREESRKVISVTQSLVVDARNLHRNTSMTQGQITDLYEGWRVMSWSSRYLEVWFQQS